MSIKMVVVVVDCDGCGEEFRVDMELTEKHPADRDVFEAAEEAIDNGTLVDDNRISSVRHGMHLCGGCEMTIYEKYRDGEPQSAEEITAALSAADDQCPPALQIVSSPMEVDC
jgi:hypothetical protein